MFDRTTKMLLAMLVVGVWGLLLRPAFTPIPTRADTPMSPANPSPAFTVTEKGVYVYHTDGNVYLLDPMTLAIQARSYYVPVNNPQNLKFSGSVLPLPTFVLPSDLR